MAFSVKNIVKKRFKAKKHPKKQVQLDRIAYDNITKLRGEISLNPNKDHSSNFSRIVRQFFMGLLKIKHNFTYEEFIEDIKKKRLPSELKSEMADFFKELSELEYKQQTYSVAELDAMIRIFESIVPRVMAEKRSRVKEKELTKFEKIVYKLHLQNLHFPVPHPKVIGESDKEAKPKKESIKLAKKQKLKKKQSSELKPSFEISKLFKRKPKDNLLYVYDLIGESYKAISDKKIELASLKIKEIESILPILHTSESAEIKKDLKKLKSEVSETKKSLKDMPLPPSKPVTMKKKKKVKLEEIPLPPLPELDLPKISEEVKIKEEIKEEKKKKIELLPLSPAPDFVPKVKEEDETEEMFEPEPLPQASELISEPMPELEPAPEPVKEPVKIVEPESKIKKFELDLSEEQSSSDDAQISESKKLSDKSKISDKPEIEYYPEKFTKDSPSEPSEETLKAITESEPVVFPTAEDINSLSLGSINKEGGSFKPKRIFVPAEDGSERVIKPKTKEKTKLIKAKQVETKPPIEEREKQEKILAKIEDLENLIMTAQQMINLKNYSEAKNTYSQALDAKKALKLKKSDSKKIDYDLQGIDLDLKIAGMT